MSDNRSISGTVKVEQDATAATAYRMASDLWFQEHQDNPRMSDREFLSLVSECTRALRGINPNR
ncbi:MAG: hypothetical protein AAGK00_18270 [Pseudomonadota bacterium]